jgi:hypothetical protein
VIDSLITNNESSKKHSLARFNRPGVAGGSESHVKRRHMHTREYFYKKHYIFILLFILYINFNLNNYIIIYNIKRVPLLIILLYIIINL